MILPAETGACSSCAYLGALTTVHRQPPSALLSNASCAVLSRASQFHIRRLDGNKSPSCLFYCFWGCACKGSISSLEFCGSSYGKEAPKAALLLGPASGCERPIPLPARAPLDCARHCKMLWRPTSRE